MSANIDTLPLAHVDCSAARELSDGTHVVPALPKVLTGQALRKASRINELKTTGTASFVSCSYCSLRGPNHECVIVSAHQKCLTCVKENKVCDIARRWELYHSICNLSGLILEFRFSFGPIIEAIGSGEELEGRLFVILTALKEVAKNAKVSDDF